MPWTHCELPDLPDSDPCPTCKITKAAWTVKVDATKTFQVARKARPKQKKTGWLELELVGGAGATCEVELPDGTHLGGELDLDGRLRIDEIYDGACRVRFPDDPARWTGMGEVAGPAELALHAPEEDGWIPLETNAVHRFERELISLREALRQRNGSPVDLFGAEGSSALATWERIVAACPIGKITAPTSSENPVWSWTLEAPGADGKLVVKDLRARVRDLNFSQFQVADRLEWSPVEVEAADGKHTLPLSPRYHLEGLHVGGGLNPGSDEAGHYWKLPAKLDESFRLVFGYELVNGEVRPLPHDDARPALDRAFFPSCPAPAPSGDPERAAGPGPVPDDAPLRIAVVATLMCNRERPDFEPGGVLGAGRFYPVLQLLSNKDLKGARHTTTLARPARTTETDAGLGGKPSLICCGEMLPEIGQIFFTDTNEQRLDDILNPAVHPLYTDGQSDGHMTELLAGPVTTFLNQFEGKPAWQLYTILPLWNNFFDYYDLDPAPGDAFEAVTLDGPGTTGKPLEVSVLLFPPVQGLAAITPGIDMVQGEPAYERMPVRKVPRQGEYDNVHLAPKMILSPALRALPPNTAQFANAPVAGVAPAGGWKDWGLDRTSMAPFCVHDCLHTHWRWSAQFQVKHVMGWSGFDPYVKAGAPLVPRNQAVHVAFPANGTQVETTTIRHVDAGRWQVAHHPGSAFPLAAADPAKIDGGRAGIDLMGYLLNEPVVYASAERNEYTPDVPVLAKDSWTMFYFRLRFGGTRSQPMERLKVDPVTRAKLRKQGL